MARLIHSVGKFIRWGAHLLNLIIRKINSILIGINPRYLCSSKNDTHMKLILALMVSKNTHN